MDINKMVSAMSNEELRELASIVDSIVNERFSHLDDQQSIETTGLPYENVVDQLKDKLKFDLRNNAWDIGNENIVHFPGIGKITLKGITFDYDYEDENSTDIDIEDYYVVTCDLIESLRHPNVYPFIRYNINELVDENIEIIKDNLIIPYTQKIINVFKTTEWFKKFGLRDINEILSDSC